MTDSIHTLFSAWGDPSPDARATKTDAAIGTEFYYADPNAPAPIRGRDAYLAYIGQFGDMMPGASAEVVAVAEHNGHARATVDFLKDGARMMRGQYFADLDGGRVVRLIGFPGMGDPA